MSVQEKKEERTVSLSEAIRKEYDFLKYCGDGLLNSKKSDHEKEQYATCIAVSFNRFRSDIDAFDTATLRALYDWVDYKLGPLQIIARPPIPLPEIAAGIQYMTDYMKQHASATSASAFSG